MYEKTNALVIAHFFKLRNLRNTKKKETFKLISIVSCHQLTNNFNGNKSIYFYIRFHIRIRLMSLINRKKKISRH